MLRVKYIFSAALVAGIATNAGAADKFSLHVTPGAYYGRYEGSQYRDHIHGENVYVEGNAAQWGFSTAYEHSRIEYKLGIPDYEQNAGLLSGHATYTPQNSQGSYTFRLNYYVVNDNDNYRSGDDVRVIAPQISYSRLNHSTYLDLGYADSRYESSTITAGALKVQQWTPTLGFALTSGATNWLTLRGYYIHSSNPQRSQNKTDTSAVQLKYLYYPLVAYKLIPHSIEVGALVGERIYAVDRDTESVANLADLEKTGISLGAQWQLTESTKVHIVGSRSKFREQTYFGYNDYFQKTLWLGIVTHW